MIRFTFESDADSQKIARILGNMRDQARPVLKKALNATAKDARKLLAKKAQETYAVKISGFNKGTKIKNATNANLAATINVTGRANELISFRVNPATYRAGAARPDIIKGKVLKASSLKQLKKGNVKAFIVKYASGHVTVAQRLDSERLPIKTLYSPSNPSMIGSAKVYGVLRPQIGEMLQDEICKQISKTLSKGAST